MCVYKNAQFVNKTILKETSIVTLRKKEEEEGGKKRKNDENRERKERRKEERKEGRSGRERKGRKKRKKKEQQTTLCSRQTMLNQTRHKLRADFKIGIHSQNNIIDNFFYRNLST